MATAVSGIARHAQVGLIVVVRGCAILSTELFSFGYTCGTLPTERTDRLHAELRYAAKDLHIYNFSLSDAEMATLSRTGKQIKSCQQAS